MDYKHHYEKYKKEKGTEVSLDQFNDIIHYIEERGKLKNTFKFYHMVYDFYQDLDKEDKLQRDLIKELVKEFRVSSVTCFGVLKYFRE